MRNRLLHVNIIRFVLLLFIQIVILDNLRIHGFTPPYIYILFIMLLPMRLPGASVLIIAFGTGIIMDSFSNTSGIHAAASVLIAFLRPVVFRTIAPAMGYEEITTPGIKRLGFVWFIVYAFIMVLTHHVVLFIIEAFTFSEIFFILSKVALSGLMTIIVIMMYEYIFYNKT